MNFLPASSERASARPQGAPIASARAHADHADRPASPRPFEDRHGGCLVKYRPQPTPDGRYLAFAIISSDLAPSRTLGSVMPDLPSFRTHSEAAQAGWLAGMRWVDANR